MSGHNKFSQIKRQKEKTDAVKSKVFGKFAKHITDEARKLGGDKNAPGLKTAIDRARAVNMPNESIERAVKKATVADAAVMDAVTYEAYGPGGSALIIEVLTTNRNKAAQEVKAILARHGFSLAGMGAAKWSFSKEVSGWTPIATTPLEDADVSLLETLVDELESNEEVQEVFTNAE